MTNSDLMKNLTSLIKPVVGIGFLALGLATSSLHAGMVNYTVGVAPGTLSDFTLHVDGAAESGCVGAIILNRTYEQAGVDLPQTLSTLRYWRSSQSPRHLQPLLHHGWKKSGRERRRRPGGNPVGCTHGSTHRLPPSAQSRRPSGRDLLPGADAGLAPRSRGIDPFCGRLRHHPAHLWVRPPAAQAVASLSDTLSHVRTKTFPILARPVCKGGPLFVIRGRPSGAGPAS